MTRLGGAVVALAVATAGAATGGARLEITGDGGVAEVLPLGPDGRWCLVWNHSVTGIEVSDCFRADGATLVLERSHQPDFAAGLGHTPGRGVVISDGAGGYWIEGMDTALPDGLALRVGSARVNHRLRVGGVEHPLPAGLAGRRALIRLGHDG